MYTLNRNAIVPYTDRQMFELVNNIEDYPRFLPWCQRSQIISRTDTEVIAEISVNWKGIRRSFITCNRLFPYQRMDMSLVKGPLQHMEGTWSFYALEDHACQVVLDLEFDFTGSFVDRFFRPIFQHIADTLVEAFCKRAAELYGNKD